MPGIAGLGYLDAPPETLIALREIDDKADLVHLGEDEWMLGVRVANPEAAGRLRERLKRLDPFKAHHELGREFQLLQFYATGFRPIALYRIGDWGKDELGKRVRINMGYIVDDFRIRDFNWRIRPTEADAEFRSAISLDEGNKRRAQVMAEYFDQEGGSLFRHVFRAARSFINRVAMPSGG